MRKIAAAVLILLVSFTLATAEEFMGTITKVEGNKITYTKFGGGFKKGGKKGGKKGEKGTPPEALTVTAASGCKVLKGKFNRGGDKKFAIEAGDDLPGGLKSKLFTFKLTAQLTTENDKVTQVVVIPEVRGVIKKVNGGKITFVQQTGFGFGPQKGGDETTLTATSGVKVLKGKFDPEAMKMEYSAVEGGLKNEAFDKGDARVTLTFNSNFQVTEVKMGGFGGGFKKGKGKKKSAE